MTISADLFGPIRSLTREFWNGDCLELMRDIPTGSVDMILCDLPYGTTACVWDSIIPFEPLWEQYRRVTKPNAAIVLTASQPFTTALIASNYKMFKYCWVWDKKSAANVMNAKKHPLKVHEDVVVFGKGSVRYIPQMQIGKMRLKGGANRKSTGIYGQDRIEIGVVNDQYYPKSILEVSNASQTDKFHPTQKPVALFEYLIRTYTNPGDTVLDNCAGSGTTAIAAINSDRGYICIEKDAEYYRRASERIASHA
ncbi:modification DNA-methylase protein [Rhizobium phage RHph_Y52]|nr:modification DNA-methylase protein [Rhizobium phage RHph_Y21]QIG76827.1 modification DNA-methylase protein [Rhizobium phage RHph_Y52]